LFVKFDYEKFATNFWKTPILVFNAKAQRREDAKENKKGKIISGILLLFLNFYLCDLAPSRLCVKIS